MTHQKVSAEDDSDGPLYSDVDESPTPPPRRRSLAGKARAQVEDDLYGTEYFEPQHSIACVLLSVVNILYT